MPYTIKSQQIAVKDPDTGEYVGVDLLTEQTAEGLLNEIETLGNQKKNAVTTEGTNQVTNVRNAGAETVTLVNNTVNQSQIAVDNLQQQKDDLVTSVTDMLSTGTDNSLTTPNVPADAKAIGDLYETIVVDSETQPNKRWNRVWVKPATEDIEIPTMDEVVNIKSELNSIVDSTTNLLNPYAAYLQNGASISVDGSKIEATSVTNGTYRSAMFYIPRNNITKVSISVSDINVKNSNKAVLRVGYANEINGNQTWADGSMPATDNNIRSGTYNISNGNYIVIAFYAVWSTKQSAGAVAEFTNVMVTAGEVTNPTYKSPVSAVDLLAREAIEKIEETYNYFDGTLLPYTKDLATSNIWVAGSIDENGLEVSQVNSIRTDGYIPIDSSNLYYFQAYYDIYNPNEIGEGYANYDMRNAYIHEYDLKGNHLVRHTLSQIKTLGGIDVTLLPNCAYIRINFYTRRNNNTLGQNENTILPEAIWFDIKTGENWLPPYYDYYLQKKAEVINHYLRGEEFENGEYVKKYTPSANIISFFFITDQHATDDWNQWKSPQMLKRLSELTGINILFSGGDVDHTGLDTARYAELLRDNFSGEIHHVVGNHDFLHGNTGTSLYRDLDIYNRNQIGNKDAHYYYVDDPQQRIRYIVLAAFSESLKTKGTGETESAAEGYSSGQRDWLQETLNSLPSSWKVIVFTHYFFTINESTMKVARTGGKICWDIVKNNPSIIAIIQGHTHADRMIKNFESDSNAVPVIITSCDKNKPYGSEVWPVNRTSNTIYEQLFDVIIINQENRTIRAVRIGGLAMNGVNDDTGAPVEERVITY